MIIHYKNLPEKNFLIQYFYILNTAQPVGSKKLTKSEIKVLVEFMILPSKFEDKRFGALAKKKVIESLEKGGYVVTRANLNNKIYSLLDKGYLWKDMDSVIYPKKFVLHGVEGILHTINSGKNFDIIFRFSDVDDNSRPERDLQTDLPTHRPADLQGSGRDKERTV